MAKRLSLSRRLGVSPDKLALIGVLAVVLIAVIYIQYGPSSDGDVASATRAARQAPHLPSRSKPAHASTLQARLEDSLPHYSDSYLDQQWTTPDLAGVIRHDPFALPSRFPQQASATPSLEVIEVDESAEAERLARKVDEIRAKLTELQQRGVRVIVDGRKEAAAIIGNLTVRIGDQIEGFTVTSIDADGVYIERKLEQ